MAQNTKGRRPSGMSSRSYNMSMIKPKNTKPELLLRRELWRRGLRYRKNAKNVIGHPDIVFLRAQIAVFCDGTFWHGYEWDKKKEQIKTNRDYWISKIERNMERDFNYTEELIEQGWLVLRFWDFEIKEDVTACADKIELSLKNRLKK